MMCMIYIYIKDSHDCGICGNAWSVTINGGNFLPIKNLPLIFKHKLLTFGWNCICYTSYVLFFA